MAILPSQVNGHMFVCQPSNSNRKERMIFEMFQYPWIIGMHALLSFDLGSGTQDYRSQWVHQKVWYKQLEVNRMHKTIIKHPHAEY